MASDELVPWLRQRIRERMFLATHAVEPGSFAEWEERSSGVLVTGDGTDSDPWRGTWVTGDSSVTRLMEANDPRDTMARCEFELGVLDLYAQTLTAVESPPAVPPDTPMSDMDRGRIERAGPGARVVSARDYLDARRELAVLEPVIRMLGYAYRFEDGYREEWKP